MRSVRSDGETPGGEDRARAILAALEEKVARRIPAWRDRGPEDPAWVLLEVLAEALAELSASAGDLERRLLERAVALLGEEPAEARPAEGVVVFVPDDGRDDPVSVPRGTVVMADRRGGEPSLPFETIGEAWASPTRLLRVASVGPTGVSEIFAYPQAGWDGAAVPLFGGRSRIPRYLYLGDPILDVLRGRPGGLWLDWPGVPPALVEGHWEISVRGGWRAVRLEAEEVRDAGGKRALRLRIPGPLPDLAAVPVEGTSSPWLRLLLPGDRRTVLPQATWTGGEPPGTASPFALPRPVLRVLTRDGDRWEDHSLSGERIQAADAPASSDPAVYLGWERPTPASVAWVLPRRSVPHGWGGADGVDAPRIAWECSSGRGFRPLDVDDGTRAFTRSGVTSWALPTDWTPQEQVGERLYWVRARWVSGSFATSPTVRCAIPCAALVRQGTRSEGQVLEVRIDAGGRGDLGLSVHGGEPDRIERLDVRKAGGDWVGLIADGRASGQPEDRSAISEGASGRFRVLRDASGRHVLHLDRRWEGDIQVRVPPIRVCRGARGNLPPGRISLAAGELRGIRRIEQPLPTEGGRDVEGAEGFRRRVLAEWKTGDRAVTPLDYRRHALALEPEVARVEVAAAAEDPSRVLVVLVPSEPCVPGRFRPERLAWLEARLEEKSPLGTVVEVSEAIYLPVSIRARRVAPGSAPGESTRRTLEERLRRYLHPLWGGPDGRGFPAGKWLNEEDFLDIMAPARDVRADRATGQPDRRDAEPADWDPRAWRFEVVLSGGPDLPRGGARHEPRLAPPLVIPVLERITVEPDDRSSAG